MKVAIVLTVLLFACSASYLALAEPKNSPKPQEVFGSYWTAEPGWHTEFQLRNNLLAGPLTVTPVLRLANGQEYSLALVTIAPSDVATVDVSQELSNIASPLLEQAGTYGSVVFRFTSPFARNLYAAVMIHEVGQPIGYHVDAFPIDPEYTAGAREGIWWLPRPTVKDSLIIANGSDQPNHCRLYLYNAAGKAGQQDLPIGARQTLRLVVADLIKQAGLTGSYGGLRLEVAQRAGSIDTVYFLYDESNGFSALMKMFDHNPATKLEDRLFAGSQVWKTWAPMLPLQNPDPALALPSGTQLQPKIFLRNTTAKPQVATVKMTYRNNLNRGMLELQPIQLQPYETRLVDVLALQQNKQIPTDAHWALVEISSLGNPDDIMAIASSFDSTGRYGSQTPFADQLSDHWVAGKFEVDATHNSLISVTNAGKKPTDAVLTFHYNHGQGQYQVRRTIAAGDQLWLNLGDIIPGSIPDTKGRTFPPDLTSGTYEIREPGRNNDPSLFEGKIIVDKTYGHLAYGCTTCCGDGYPGIIADPENLPFQAQDSLSVIATNSCTGFDDDLTAQFTGWDTSNHSVATMSSRQIIGVGAGSTNAFSSGTFNYNNGVSKYCTLKNYTPHNSTLVGAYQVEPININSQGPVSAGSCPTNQYAGYVKYVTNQVQNRDGSAFAVAGLAMTDTIYIGSRHDLGSGTATKSATTTGDGSFQDQYSVCSSACPGSSGETDATQSWTLNGLGLYHVNGIVYKCSSISIDGH